MSLLELSCCKRELSIGVDSWLCSCWMAQLASCNPHNRSKSIALFDLEVSRKYNYYMMDSVGSVNQAGMGLHRHPAGSHHVCSNVTIHFERH